MPPELHHRVRELFDEALERPETERLRFLESASNGDLETFQAVVRLLDARTRAHSFLENQAPRLQRAGRYVLGAELGRGAMGVVYEAVDHLIGRTVAVKIILQPIGQPDSVGFLHERLFREARSAGGLSHPGIVAIYDADQENDMAFIVMERVNGPSLQHLLASRSRLDCSKAIDILRQAAVALDHAHQNGRIHRDIKPANIMLHEGTTVKITDFGIAKIVSAAEQTRTGGVLGTPSYMSPEQIEARPVDGRSDQFSLAVVAFEMLTGSRPFEADSVTAVAHVIVYGPRPSARTLNSVLPAPVDEVFYHALGKLPEDRYPNCTEFVRALESALGGALKPVSQFAGVSSERPPRAVQPPDIQTAKTGAGFPRRYLFAFPVALALALVVLFYIRVTPPPTSETRVDQSAITLYNEAVAKRGAGQPRDAVAFFRRAADLGEPRAMLELGEMYTGGMGVTRDDYEATRWFRKAADLGVPSAMLYLGGMYLLGSGVSQDYAQAAEWLQKAADRGEPRAMVELGEMYENGQGLIRNLGNAQQLYGKAAALGNEEAAKHLGRLAGKH